MKHEFDVNLTYVKEHESDLLMDLIDVGLIIEPKDVTTSAIFYPFLRLLFTKTKAHEKTVQSHRTGGWRPRFCAITGKKYVI